MGSSLQAPSLSLSTSSSYLSPNLLFRSHSKLPSIWRSKCKFQPRIMAAYEPTSPFRFCRRDLLLSTSLALILPPKGVGAEEDVKMADFVDDINAYTYSYPVELPSKNRLFKWVESRKPERYSSAAPLSPNARLRIVSERVDFIDNLIISVSIGPPNPDFLKSKDKSTWNAKDVADSVLSDKSALRVTSSQRLAESSILDAYASEIDGERYWFYEYLVRKSPTKSVLEPSNFRQYVASTVERDDRPPVTRHQRKMDELKDALAKLETQLTSTQANQTTLATRLSAVEKTAPFEGSEPNGPMAELVSIVRRLEEQVSLSTNNSIHTENARIYSPLDNDTTRKKWHSYGHNPWESWPFSSE